MPEVEHLKMIEAIISRLAGNSFLIKGWTVTLVAGLSALAKADSDRDFAWIAVGVVAVLALLDAYYLALERAYRQLYKTASTAEPADWSLVVTKPGLGGVLGAAGSFAVLPLHAVVAAGAVLVALTT